MSRVKTRILEEKKIAWSWNKFCFKFLFRINFLLHNTINYQFQKAFFSKFLILEIETIFNIEMGLEANELTSLITCFSCSKVYDIPKILPCGK